MLSILRIARLAAMGVVAFILSAGLSSAAPITVVYDFGVVNGTCTTESAACPQDILAGTTPSVVGSVFTNVFNGGYRAGGRVAWDVLFDASPFAAITSMTLRVDVIGLYSQYPGNIDPSAGQLGNYLAIDGVRVEPFLFNTDGLDSYVFSIPILSAGPHQFSVWAYDRSTGQNHEGWGGVDFARLTVEGDSTGAAQVPEHASLALFGTVVVGLVGAARRRLRK